MTNEEIEEMVEEGLKRFSVNYLDDLAENELKIIVGNMLREVRNKCEATNTVVIE